jgi:hypothetical protein
MTWAATGNDHIGQNIPSYTKGEISTRRNVGLSQPGDRVRLGISSAPPSNPIRSGLPSTASERDIYQRDNPLGTNLASNVRVMPAISRLTPPEIDMLKTLYTFRESDQAKSFLSGNNTLRRMLSTIYSKIRKEFPSEKIILDVVSDSPHSSEKEVVISVTTSLPVDKAIERLDKVEDVRWNKDSIDPYVDVCVKLKYL